jgi:hypothetical protein
MSNKKSNFEIPPFRPETREVLNDILEDWPPSRFLKLRLALDLS